MESWIKSRAQYLARKFRHLDWQDFYQEAMLALIGFNPNLPVAYAKRKAHWAMLDRMRKDDHVTAGIRKRARQRIHLEKQGLREPEICESLGWDYKTYLSSFPPNPRDTDWEPGYEEPETFTLDAFTKDLTPRESSIVKQRHLEHKTLDVIAESLGTKKANISRILSGIYDRKAKKGLEEVRCEIGA